MIVSIGNQSYWTFDGFVTATHGTTYYVAKTGSNGHSCSSAQPPSTPRHTMNATVGCLCAGDTLLVGQGTYAEVVRELEHGHYTATNALDGHPIIFWHTNWYLRKAPRPPLLVLDLGDQYRVDGFRYLPRQDSSLHGTFWNTAVAAGMPAANTREQTVRFTTHISSLCEAVVMVALRESKHGYYSRKYSGVNTVCMRQASAVLWHVRFSAMRNEMEHLHKSFSDSVKICFVALSTIFLCCIGG